jgi:hypothetical protein
VAGHAVITSPTISSKPIGMRVSTLDDMHQPIDASLLCCGTNSAANDETPDRFALPQSARAAFGACSGIEGDRT